MSEKISTIESIDFDPQKYFQKNILMLIGSKKELQAIPEKYHSIFLDELDLSVQGLYINILENESAFKCIKGSERIFQKAKQEFIKNQLYTKEECLDLISRYHEFKKNIPDFLDLLTKTIKARLKEKTFKAIWLEPIIDFLNSNSNKLSTEEKEILATINSSIRQEETANQENQQFAYELKEIQKARIPKYLFHVTTKTNWAKIKNKGKLEQSEAYFSNGKMVSLTNNIDYGKNIVKKTQNVDEKELVVLRIDTTKINRNGVVGYGQLPEFHYLEDIPLEYIEVV